MAKDYYKILDITDEEKKLNGEEFEKVLKNKYRKVAMKWHPDRNPNDPSAEEKFKEAAEAYETLKDVNKRAEYDDPNSKFEFHGSNFGGMDIDEILRGFGMGGMDFGFSRKNANVQVKGSTIRIPFKLTLEEIHSGVTKKIRYKRFEPCDHCNGSGMTTESRKKTCRSCGGTGTVFSNNGFMGFSMSMSQTCPTCGGNGYIIENPCSHCGGYGIVQKETEREIVIGKGVLDGMSLVISGGGNYPHHNKGTIGDLLVTVQALPHKVFDTDNNDLYFNLNISVIDAIMGCTVNIDTIDGKQLTAKIPQGTNHGHRIRFGGYGLPKYGTKAYGDMIGIINVMMPKEINEEEKKLLELLRENEHFN